MLVFVCVATELVSSQLDNWMAAKRKARAASEGLNLMRASALLMKRLTTLRIAGRRLLTNCPTLLEGREDYGTLGEQISTLSAPP